ncbi:helix-turn-helix domain-containing protein [Nocardia sp. NPDC051750]|uniref:GbsR/MarR family transcriptional regulator n=1 Tax=Nocardia sp. NPDC051750 TaxID=3364325 RepID=UPI00378B5113
MPGDRLTQDDRQRIAAGLAAGLAYAEIARQLGRPTSTVSREVARNGGPGRYRAERAHRATTARARRPRRPLFESRSANTGNEDEAVTAYAAELTELFTRTGFPHMSARIVAYLYITDAGSSTAAELSRQLRVSPASVSTAVAYLQGQRLIQRERDPGTRRDRYTLDDQTWHRATLASIRTNDLLAEAAVRGAALMVPGSPAGARLQAMGRYLGSVGRDMERSAARWREFLEPSSR